MEESGRSKPPRSILAGTCFLQSTSCARRNELPTMIRIRLCALLVGALAMGFAPAPFPKKERPSNRDDLDIMQGMWRMTRYEMSGSPTDHNYKIRIRNNRWTFFRIVNNREQESSTYTLTLDPKHAPRAFEW